MLYALLKTLHLLAIVIWVGGMFFAHCALRPALDTLDPPARLRLMHAVLSRFFAHVLAASVIAWITGLWMIGRTTKLAVTSGGQFAMPLDWSIMSALGTAMVLIFFVIRFRFFPRLAQAISAADWPTAGGAMALIRRWVGINLVLGLVIIVVTLLY